LDKESRSATVLQSRSWNKTIWRLLKSSGLGGSGVFFFTAADVIFIMENHFTSIAGFGPVISHSARRRDNTF